MARRPWLAGVLASLVAACGVSQGVQTESARQAPTTPPSTVAPPTTITPTTDPSTTTPATTEPSTSPTGSTVAPPLARDVLDVGESKPARPWDDLVRAALADLERWWTEEFPVHYGSAYTPLSGSVYAAYPQRTAPIPGCGTTEPTSYEEINQYGAFYCQEGDFLVYDEGDDGVLASLANEFGPPILGVVLAHEYGHVVQARAGEFNRELPTITTEQQADCFAGAWVARAVRGEATGVAFSDSDVRTGLIAMITVRDPIGINQLDPGGHGSAFDRVGAFQVGYVGGVESCIGLLDEPLPLVPNVFSSLDDDPDGNAPFGYGQGQVGGFLVDDLNVYWPQTLTAQGRQLQALQLVPITGPSGVTCDEPGGDIALGAVHCPATGQVFFDETFGQDVYTRFGDFAVGYVLGMAWSEAAQQALGSPLEGEERALVSDCLTGAWAADLIPRDNRVTRNVVISPGDLDEAIQTALVVGDSGSSEDIVGSGFEKIASFRQGVLDGISSCIERLDD